MAIRNVAVDADNAIVLRWEIIDHIGTLVSILEYHRENAKVSSVYVVIYIYEYVYICLYVHDMRYDDNQCIDVVNICKYV